VGLTGRLEQSALTALLARRLTLDAPVIERLAYYGALLLDANRRVNLTGAKTADELVEQIEDSIDAVRFVHGALVDVGSGGGLPAIPLAIAAGVHVTLVESTRKKARFLERALADLGIEGEVVAMRAELAAREERLRERFDTGTARAVASAPAVAELLFPFIAVGGVAALQRGTLDERERNALADAALMLGAEVEAEHPLRGNRRIVVVRKRQPTPQRFPRRPGIPEKRPLCF
jgi:16S rRNA (guanine527-N7)-methyltransferase